MQRSMRLLGVVICALALPVLADPARSAEATFVSQATGNNANACTSPAAPCLTLGTALTKTDAGGVIHVAPGEYSTLNITKAVEIIADGGQATINSASTIVGSVNAAIIVNVAGPDDVRIRGFTIAPAGGLASGIGFVGQGTLYVEDCTLVNNSGANSGIAFVPSGVAELYVSDSFITGGSGSSNGILIRPTAGTVTAVLDNNRLENDVSGITVDGRNTTGSNTVTIRNSIISGDSSYGIGVIDGGSGGTNIVVEGSTTARNGTFGVLANGANVTMRVRNSTITGNGTGVSALNGAKIISHGGNVVAGNTVNGAFTSTVAQQ